MVKMIDGLYINEAQQKHRWAFKCLPSWILVGFGCVLYSSCRKIEPPTLVEHAMCQLPEQPHNELKSMALTCQGQHAAGTPLLYAHFLEQSLKDDICFEDVVNNDNGELSCAPGPYLIEHRNVVHIKDKLWKMRAMPDYFVWHLDNQDASRGNIYITNQSGYPIKAQIIKLEGDGESTLVLFPKTTLSPGQYYYIYLTVSNKDQEQQWIQPLASLAGSAS